MAFTATDWTIDRQTGDIRYTGADHNFDTGTPSYATVIEFHRALQALADNTSSTGNDDELDITDNNPSDRSTDNIIELKVPYNIDDTASEHLYDGSIIQNNSNDIYDGIVNFGNASVQIQIIQNGSVIADDWWNKSTTNTPSQHETGASAATLDDSSAGFTASALIGYTIYNTTDGSQALITANTTTTATGVLYGGTEDDWDVSDNYLLGVPLNGDSASGISHRFMIKTRSDGADIDGRRLIGIARRFGNTYSEFKINGTSRGNNVLALSDATDLNNASNPQTVSTWTAFANDSVGFDASQDVDGDTTNEEYYSRWDITAGTPASPTINQLYEWSKWITDHNYTTNLYGIPGNSFRGITAQIPWDTVTGTFDESSYLVWGTNAVYDAAEATAGTVGAFYTFSLSGAVGQLLAIDDDTGSGNVILAIESGTLEDNDVASRVDGTAADGFTIAGTPSDLAATGGVGVILADDGTDTTWIQLLKGGSPVNDLQIWEATTAGVYDNDAGDKALVNGTVTDREALLTFPFLGASTGSSIIGGYGVGIDSGDLTASDILFDLGNNQITPPNNVTVTVGGIVSGEDYVQVAQRGYRFAYDNQGGTGSYSPGDTLTFGGVITATGVVAEIVEQDPIGYIIVSEEASGSYGATQDNATITNGSTLADVNGDFASDIDKRQYQVTTTALSSADQGSVTVNTAIATDTPSSGTIRVQDDSGYYRRLVYTSYTGAVFTIDAATSEAYDSPLTDNEADFNVTGAAVGNNVYISYIDKLADATSATFTTVYQSGLGDRNLFVRVRDGAGTPIKTFETTVTMGSSGGSATAIRTTDE